MDTENLRSNYMEGGFCKINEDLTVKLLKDEDYL